LTRDGTIEVRTSRLSGALSATTARRESGHWLASRSLAASGKVPSSLNRSIDGAAALIGSSEAIRRVRERIERVAATDFTAHRRSKRSKAAPQFH